MKKTQANESWWTPSVIVAIVALLFSILWNIILFGQNITANKSAEDASIRADLAAAKTDSLLKQKGDWLKELRKQLNDVNTEIDEAQAHLNADAIGGSETTPGNADQYNGNLSDQSVELDKLEAKKDALTNQINYFMANYHNE